MTHGASHKSPAMRARRLEIEAKFVVPDERAFERLRSLATLGDYTLTACGEQDIVDLYLDTADRDLLRAGWGCRLRDGLRPGRTLVTLKSIGRARGSVHRRQEHEIEIASGLAPGAWPPGAVRDIVTEVSRRRALVPLLTLRQHRTLHDIRRANRAVAVRFLDRVEMQSGERMRTTLELEIELAAEGTLADLQDLEHATRRFRLQPQPLSKLERALAWMEGEGSMDAPAGDRIHSSNETPDASGSRAVGAAPRPAPAHAPEPTAAVPVSHTARSAPKRRPAPPHPERAAPHKSTPKKRKGPEVRADQPFAEAGRKILAYHCERMLQHEDGTRAGIDPEELHDMRVATRRQRAALRIVLPHFRRKAIRPVRDGLRDVATVLGAVRDLDVLLQAAVGYQRTLEPEEAAALHALLDAWSARRDAARAAMLAHLDSDVWASFKDDYRLFLEAPGTGVRAQLHGELPRPQLVAQVLPAEVWQHFGSVRAYEAVLPWAAVETLHALRIECKRLRYVLEFFHEPLGVEVEQAIEPLVALQDHLGLLNDSHVTVGLVREFLAGAHAAGHAGAAIAAGRYLEFHEDKIQSLRRGVDAPWRQVVSAEFKQALARAVAVL